MTLVVVRIGFEEIQPSGRHVPEPRVWQWVRYLAECYRANAEREEGNHIPSMEMRELRKEIRSKVEEVENRLERVRELRKAARGETRDEILGVRLKPRHYKWLGRRAEEQGTGSSSLLRARALEGIKDRCWLSRLEEKMKEWFEKTKRLRWKILEVGDGEEVRADLRASAEEVDRVIDRREEEL